MSNFKKQNYKFDETFGFIPDDWEVRNLGEVANINRKSENLPNEFFYIDLESVEKGVLFQKDKILKENAPSRAQRKLSKGDILFQTVRPYQMNNYLFELDGNYVASTGYAQIRALQDKKFLYQYLHFHKFVNSVIDKCTGSNYPAINPSDLANLKILLPPLPEQKRIAEVLSDVDELLDTTKKLIAKKKNLKLAAMQKLLAPKPNWETKPLGELGNTYGGLSGKNKNDFGSGNGLYIPFLNIMNNFVIDINSLEKVNIKNNEIQNVCLKNDLFFNTSSETPEEVGMCATLQDDISNLYLNSFCFGYRIKRMNSNLVNPNFLVYFFRSNYGRKIMLGLAQGSTRYNLPKDKFIEHKIPLPPLSEQNKIAEILSDMDDEILSLEKEADKFKSIKTALMQELLSGKIRLKG